MLILVCKIQVRKAAIDIVRGLTGSSDGLQSLTNYAKIALPSLSRLLSEKKVLLLCLSCYFNIYQQDILANSVKVNQEN